MVNRSLFGKLGQQLASRAASIRSGILTLAGLGSLVAGAWTYGMVAGFVATGLSLLVLDLYWSAGEKAPAR